MRNTYEVREMDLHEVTVYRRQQATRKEVK